MTLAVARIFGERIAMLSDTMLSGRQMAKSDAIPGQLKSVVLSYSVSVSYCGTVDYALGVLRKARQQLEGGSSLGAVLDGLVKASADGNLVEFIVAAHNPKPVLFLIREGQLACGLDRYCIGDQAAAAEVHPLMEDEPKPTCYPISAEYGSEDESRFGWAFCKLVDTTMSPIVGGLAVWCLGSPYGHSYINRAEARVRGTEASKYSTYPTRIRGTPVIGVFLDIGNLGFIYSPLESDAPTKCYPTSNEEIAAEVERRATILAGHSCLKTRSD